MRVSEFEKIAKALTVCLPETQEESCQECEDCPFFTTCKNEEVVGLPTTLMLAIRNYFSSHALDTNLLQ